MATSVSALKSPTVTVWQLFVLTKLTTPRTVARPPSTVTKPEPLSPGHNDAVGELMQKAPFGVTQLSGGDDGMVVRRTASSPGGGVPLWLMLAIAPVVPATRAVVGMATVWMYGSMANGESSRMSAMSL